MLSAAVIKGLIYLKSAFILFEPQHEISKNVVCGPAKPQISLPIRAVWSEPLLVAWIFYD